MAEPQSMAQRIGLTRSKGAVVVVLAVALVGAIYVRFGTSDGGSVAADAQSAAPLAAVETRVMPAPAVAAEAVGPLGMDEPTTITAQFDEAKWKPPELARVVAYDPFALPSAFPQPVRTASGAQVVEGGDDGLDADAAAAKLAEAIESLQAELRALQERGVHVILRGRDQYVAMIGDRTVHVGDEINGFTVTAIEADGVRVERKLIE